jgi:ribosomal protein S11
LVILQNQKFITYNILLRILRYFMYPYINLCLKLTPNNIILTLKNLHNNLVYSKSSGAVGYTGKQKNTSAALKTLLLRAQSSIKKYLINSQLKIF